jgi:hypothetical protein
MGIIHHVKYYFQKPTMRMHLDTHIRTTVVLTSGKLTGTSQPSFSIGGHHPDQSTHCCYQIRAQSLQMGAALSNRSKRGSTGFKPLSPKGGDPPEHYALV